MIFGSIFIVFAVLIIPMYILAVTFELIGLDGKKKPKKLKVKKILVSTREISTITSKKELRKSVREMGFAEAIKRKEEILQAEKRIKENQREK
ncbi:hypothetical protein BHE17_04730 [Planococcus maritimus]|uniref:hypothetical protein n=1 Tax=Planococcus maritimus TaxID=192421 RepID=UPI00084C0270|nr:hypothetical protein [Planococcus maritimus]OED31781.1 hypothetical protein BHE17_04730 [Planococcus maritimus]